MVLRRHDPKIVAVTGSVGKTSTKDAVYTAIAKSHFARKSEKSFNSELGVPLTILGLPTAWSSPIAWLENIVEGLAIALFARTYPEWLVLEVGADRPGDIKKLAWLKPHIVVFTYFPDVPVHVEYFDSAEQVIAEKRELKKALRSNGTLIVNADDPKMRDEEVLDGQHLIRYGFDETATIRVKDPVVLYKDHVPDGMSAVVQFQAEVLPIIIRGVVGKHHLYPVLAGVSVAVSEGMTFTSAIEAFKDHASPPGRMRILRGKNGSCILDDTYNASPVAVHAGLDTLETLACSGKKIVVLGDMMELGEFSASEHRSVGDRAAVVCDVFITVGVRMLYAAESARSAHAKVNRVEALKDTDEAIKILREIVGEGDIVLVKGSQSMRMERVVEDFLADSTTAHAVLVRQDDEWKHM